MFSVQEYANDNDAGLQTAPAQDDIYVGTAFQHQTTVGSSGINAIDDRVSFLASDDGSGRQDYPHNLQRDTDGTAQVQVYGGTSVFSGITYGDRQDVWYTTERPYAGWPLSLESDVEYANRTNDYSGDTIGETVPYLATVGQHNIPEKSLDIPFRESGHPAEIQRVRPWDILLGAWPWTGAKTSMQRPSAATPMTFDTPLEDAYPSGMGTSNADLVGQYNVLPRPMTWRAPPEPWDTVNDGGYVDSGA